MFKKYQDEDVFTKTEMNNQWNINFLQNTSCVHGVLKLKLYLLRQNELWKKY